MKKTDVLVIGTGPSAITIANDLVDQKRSVVMVSHGLNLETMFQSMLKTLAAHQPSLVSIPEISAQISKIDAAGHFLSPTTFQVCNEIYEAKRIVLATGFTPVIPFADETSVKNILFPWFICHAEKLPQSAIIVGGGPVGVAVAFYLQHHGCQVTLISKSQQLLRQEDFTMSSTIKNALLARGVAIETEAVARQVIPHGSEKKLVFERSGSSEERQAEVVVLAAGLTPHIEGLDLKKAEVFINENSAVVTMEDMKTSSATVWAVGAVKGESFSIDLERYETRLVAHNLFSPYINLQRMEWEPLPFFVPLTPEFACVGLTEAEAREKHKDTTVAINEFTTGCMKLIARRKSGTILGAHVFAPGGAELVSYFNLAMRAGIPVRDLLDQQHYSAFSRSEEIYSTLKKWDQNA